MRVKRVAVILLVISLAFGSLMVVSPTARATFIRWVTEWYETHITYRYAGPSAVEKMPHYVITALPDGYVEIESDRVEWPTYVSVVYQHEGEEDASRIYLRYIYMQQGSASNFETDAAEIIPVTVNGFNGQMLLAQDMSKSDNTITWIDTEHNLQFAIDARLSESSMLHMAESVALVEATK